MYLPLFFKSSELNCLIIGAGKIALHKINILISFRADITVISPDAISDIMHLADNNRLKWIRRRFEQNDCRTYNLVIAATSDREVNRSVYQAAKSLNIPVNVVDDPELCTVAFPAIFRDDPLVIAVSTCGQAPFMAAKVRNLIQDHAMGWGRKVKAAHDFREIVRNKFENADEQMRYFKRMGNVIVRTEAEGAPMGGGFDEWLEWLEKMERIIDEDQ